MTAYQERELLYEQRKNKGYQEILDVARTSEYPYEASGKQYVDFIVGRDGIDTVTKVRVLIDFRGECFSSFIVDGKPIPIELRSSIRNRINLSAREAYEYIIKKAKEINTNNYA